MFFILFQLTNLFQFSACESTVIYVIVEPRALNWNKFLNLDDMEKHIQFQSTALTGVVLSEKLRYVFK